jgi:hypothetical protein
MSEPHILQWLAALAKLTTPHDPARAADAMRAYFPFLVDLPLAAFTRESLEHVALSPRRMMIPDLAEVVNPLRAWWRDHKPLVAALPAPVVPDRPEPTDEERRRVREVLRGVGVGLKRDIWATWAYGPVRTVEEQLREFGA